MPIDPARLNALLDDTDADRARTNALTAPPVSPDDMGRALDLSRKTGHPSGLVAADLAQHDELDTLDRFSEAGRDPLLGAWLTPERAALVKDDLAPLTKLSASLRGILSRAPKWSMPGLLAQAGDPNLAPHLAKRFQVADVGMVADTARTLSETADRLLNPARSVVQRLQAEGIDARYEGIETFRDVADQAAAVGREVRKDQAALSQVYQRGELGYHLGQVSDSLPAMSAAAVLRDPRLAAGAMGLFTQSRGVAQGMDAGQGFGEANLEAAIPSLTEMTFSRLTFGQVFGQGSRIARMGTAGATEAAGEGATEFAQATYDGRKGTLDPVEVLWRTLDGAIAGAGMGTATAAIAPQSREQVAAAAKAVRSLDSSAGLRAFTEAAGESKTAQRAPAEVEALVGDAGSVYIPVEQARLLFQSEDFDRWAAEITGDPDASAADSGDLRIPLAKWASTVARLPNAEEWSKHARTDPEGFSAADLEAADFLEREFGLSNDEAAEAAKPVDPESTARIEQDVMGQLIGTGRYRESDAEAQAKFMAKVFGTLASRSGTDAWALYQSYNPAIRDGTERMGKPNLLDPRMNALLDAVRNRRIPDGPEVTGQTLLPFLKAQGGVMDEGGELRARDVGKLRPGLVSLTGLPLDTARELAVESGFLPEGADINDLLDAIDRELKGDPVTSPAFENRPAREFRDEALALSAQIDEQFADMTAEEFDALSNQEIVDRLAGESPKGMFGRAADLVRSLYQAVVAPKAEAKSDAFATWFGDSKVVDENGAPLVVYHGTAADIEAFSSLALGASTKATSARGAFFFAKSPKVASGYAMLSESRPALRNSIYKKASESDVLSEAMRARLREASETFSDQDVQDSAWIDEAGGGMTGANVLPVYISMQNPLVVEYDGSDYRELSFAAAVRQAREEGRDGVIFRNAEDSAHKDYSEPTDIFAVFEPTQIKSATANRGTFDPNDPSILHQSATPHPANAALLARWEADPEAVATEYAALEGTDGGRRIDTDLVRELSPEYRADRTLSPEIHTAASKITKGLFARALAQPPAAGRDKAVEFTAGGGGSGKSTATQTVLGPSNADVIYDGTLSNLARARADVAEVLKSGREARIVYVYRSPENSADSAIARAARGRRPVPYTVLAEAHANAPQVVKALAQEYAGNARVTILAINNDGGPGEARPMPVEEIPDVDRTEAEQAFRAAVEAAREAGTLDADLFRGFAGSDSGVGPEVGGRPEPGRAQQGRNAVTEDPAAGGVSRSGRLNQPADGTPKPPRGGIELFDPRNVTIHLFEKADRSTFLHEGAHFYFQVMGDLAGRPDASPQLRADMDTLLTWGQVPGATPELRLAQWRAWSLEEQRNVHEAFAEGFEQYLLEGKAPSPEVAGLMGRFRAWMVAIYGALRRHRVPLNDDVRAVFDRLVATDAEIEAAKPAPALTDEQLAAAGFTPDEIAAHRAKLESAIEAAKAQLASKALKAYERERKKWWKDERESIRAQLEEEAGATPAVQAFKALRGKGGPKLSMDALRDMLVVVPENWPKGLTGKDGMTPDAAAMLFGFDSGDALVQALMQVPDTMARLDEQADALMRERHGDPMLDGTLPEKAMRAAHNAKQVRALEDELRMLEIMAADPTAVPEAGNNSGNNPSSKMSRAPMSAEQRTRMRAQAAQRAQVARAFKAIAERKVAGQKIRDLKPGEHLAAEKRAMRRSIEAAAANDFVAAAKAKREQILHASLYRASRDAQSRATRNAKFLGKQGTAKARARLGKAGDYLEQVDGLLERFDLRKISDKASDRRQSLRAWVEAQQAAGVPVDVPESLLDDAFRTPFRELTVAEFDELATTVKHLVHLAGLKNRLLLKGVLRDREEVDNAMAESVRESLKARGALGLPSTGDQVFAGRMEFRAVQGAATDLARELDGFTDLGPVWRNTVGVIRDAANNDLNPALQAEQDAVAKLYLAHYSKAELRRMGQRRSMGELGTWTHERLLSLALNWGNAGNREAILTQARNRMTPEQVGALLSQLDARDWQFVQAVWAHIDTHWPALAEAHRRRTGLPLKKVEAAPFTVTTKDGQSLTVTGGYYPLKGEADTAKSVKDEAEDLWDALRLGRTAKAATKDGHRKERVGFGGRTVRLDLGVLDTHLRDVLRDIHLGDAVNYVHQALNGDAFGSALSETGTLEAKRALEFWLKDVASGEIAGRTWYERAGRYLRTSFTAAVLTYRVASAALQITGFAASASVLGPKLLVGIRRVQRYPRASFDYVDAASPMMKARAQGHQDAVLAVSNARSGHVVASRAAMMRWGFWMMGRVQRLVDVATWISAEADARERGLDEAAARLFADDVVTRAQGSQEFIDKTPLQRGTLGDSTRQSEWIRALSALSGYMLAKGNLLYEKTARTDFRKPGQVFTWSGHMVSLLVVEAMVAAAIRGKLPEDEDEDGYADDLAAFAGKEAWFGLVGSIPGLNAISGNLRGYGSSGIVGGMFDAFAKLYDQFRPKDDEWQEFDQAAQKATVRAIGYATGAPASAINTTIDTLHAEANGEDVKPHHYLVGPPKESK